MIVYDFEIKKMNNTYLDQLKHYLENTPKNVLDKEYKKYAYLNNIGINVFEYLIQIKQVYN